jgi:hypothetical protein
MLNPSRQHSTPCGKGPNQTPKLTTPPPSSKEKPNQLGFVKSMKDVVDENDYSGSKTTIITIKRPHLHGAHLDHQHDKLPIGVVQKERYVNIRVGDWRISSVGYDICLVNMMFKG